MTQTQTKQESEQFPFLVWRMNGGDENTIGNAVSSPVSRESDGPNHAKQGNGSGSAIRSGNSVNNDVSKAKSCKGCLFYSSRLKADSRNPVCVGLSRSLPQVPQYIVGQSEMEANKDGRGLTDFRYACVGYSLFLDRKKQELPGQETQTELPVCVGLEMLVDRRVVAPDTVQASTTAAHDSREDGHGVPQRRLPKPTSSPSEEYFARFRRSAYLVANAVAKNIYKAGNQIKQSLDSVMDRRTK